LASLLAGRNGTAPSGPRPRELAPGRSTNATANSRYLPGLFALQSSLKATADLEKEGGANDVDLLVVRRAQRTGSEAILTDVRPYLRPWIPVVQPGQGVRAGFVLRMDPAIKDELPATRPPR